MNALLTPRCVAYVIKTGSEDDVEAGRQGFPLTAPPRFFIIDRLQSLPMCMSWLLLLLFDNGCASHPAPPLSEVKTCRRLLSGVYIVLARVIICGGENLIFRRDFH